MSKNFEEVCAKRAKRQAWVAKMLKQIGRNAQDVAAYIGINPRTWREWVALGRFPKDKMELILEALSINDVKKVSPHFIWREPSQKQ